MSDLDDATVRKIIAMRESRIISGQMMMDMLNMDDSPWHGNRAWAFRDGSILDLESLMHDIETFTESQPVSEKYSWSRYFRHIPMHWDGFLWFAFEPSPADWIGLLPFYIHQGYRWDGQDYEDTIRIYVDPRITNANRVGPEILVHYLRKRRAFLSERLLSGESPPTP